MRRCATWNAESIGANEMATIAGHLGRGDPFRARG
jgi:hypothetical protein